MREVRELLLPAISGALLAVLTAGCTTFARPHTAPASQTQEMASQPPLPPPPPVLARDEDADGLPDAEDACPFHAEDEEAPNPADGCPVANKASAVAQTQRCGSTSNGGGVAECAAMDGNPHASAATSTDARSHVLSALGRSHNRLPLQLEETYDSQRACTPAATRKLYADMNRDGATVPACVAIPFADVIQTAFGFAKVTIVATNDATKHPVSLKVVVRGAPIFATYSGLAAAPTGAAVSGTLALEQQGTSLHESSFSSRLDPAARITYSELYRAAPFAEAAFLGPDGFSDRLVDLIAFGWGQEPILNMVESHQPGYSPGRQSVLDAAARWLTVHMDAVGTAHLVGELRRKRLQASPRVMSVLGARREGIEGFLALLPEIAGARKVNPSLLNAIEVLGRLGDRRAVDALLTLHAAREARPEPIGGQFADVLFSALGALGDERAIEPLVADLMDNRWQAHEFEQICAALVRIGPRAAPALAGALASPNAPHIKERDVAVRDGLVALGEAGREAVARLQSGCPATDEPCRARLKDVVDRIDAGTKGRPR